MRHFFCLLLSCFLFCAVISLSPPVSAQDNAAGGVIATSQVQVGAERTALYLPKLKHKRLGLVVNQTSRVGQQHLVDFLQASGLDVRRIFAPEHGFRGTADAGASIEDGVDSRSGVEVISLYGEQKKPGAEQLADIDMLIFDIQDVGVRYYTYISTLHYLMEAATKHQKPLMVLDRPNPNGDYVDGPVLKPAYRSFVGMHPIPLIHGLTVGELARMIKGENWIEGAQDLQLTIIPVANYTHITRYTLPIPPSPNLPNQQAIRLYPSLGLFEGTVVSVGRGTSFPFQAIGLPLQTAGNFSFTPESVAGAKYPPYRGEVCYGQDLRNVTPPPYLNLDYLRHFYQAYAQQYPEHPEKFFNDFFKRLAGNETLQASIMAGKSNAAIRQEWQDDLNSYRQLRRKYQIYR